MRGFQSSLYWVCFLLGSTFGILEGKDENPNDDNDDQRLLVDMAMTNMGEIDQSIGNQASAYNNPLLLRRLGYTGVSTSPERSLALCLTFDKADRVHEPLFRPGSIGYAWQEGYCEGMADRMKMAKRSSLEMLVFTDMIVFPNRLIELYPEIVTKSQQDENQQLIVWNNTTEYLMKVTWTEWFDRFPETDGIIVRTGETYIFDTPFHSGNSPLASVSPSTTDGESNPQAPILVSFLQSLRKHVCVHHRRKLIFRTWWNFQDSDREYFLNITSQVEAHRNLFFGVKHTAGDFFRQMNFNPILGEGNHKQVVEVQIQREYEGKAAYPLFIFEHVIYGDSVLAPSNQQNASKHNQSLANFLLDRCNTTQSKGSADKTCIIRGLWTWSRGGGWWGPYIKGSEFWINLNLHLIVTWWKNPGRYPTVESSKSLFRFVCHKVLLGGRTVSVEESRFSSSFHNEKFSNAASYNRTFLCDAFHTIVKEADQAMVYGRYCPEGGSVYDACWIWTRDDRIGGYAQLKKHIDFLRARHSHNTTIIHRTLHYKQKSLALWRRCASQYNTIIGPYVNDWNPRLHQQIRNSFLYAISYFGIIEAAWRALIIGIVPMEETVTSETNLQLLREAIRDYDARWSMYRGQALSTLEFPSIYRGYYFNLPFEEAQGGIDETIDVLRLLASEGADMVQQVNDLLAEIHQEFVANQAWLVSQQSSKKVFHAYRNIIELD